jgi:signal transduction histidine kinase
MLALVLLATLASAEGRLPVERIGTAQGLVSDRITHILRDSRGLPSMSARARRAGGTLDRASTPGLGTRIEVTVPI